MLLSLHLHWKIKDNLRKAIRRFSVFVTWSEAGAKRGGMFWPLCIAICQNLIFELETDSQENRRKNYPTDYLQSPIYGHEMMEAVVKAGVSFLEQVSTLQAVVLLHFSSLLFHLLMVMTLQAWYQEKMARKMLLPPFSCHCKEKCRMPLDEAVWSVLPYKLSNSWVTFRTYLAVLH